jgi:FkbM family methyltransferase
MGQARQHRRRDLQELYYHLHHAEWRDKELGVFRSLLAPGQVAVDVGANLGFVTTLLSSLAGPAGRVIAFEPSPRIYAKLRRTVELNQLENVTALNLGAGDAPGVLSLREVSGSSGNSSLLGDESAPATEVDVVRLDDVPEVWERRVRLLKIDTRGSSRWCLRARTGSSPSTDRSSTWRWAATTWTRR